MQTKHAAQIERLRRKLDRLLDFCRRGPLFAKQHQLFAPGPPLPEAEIQSFESRHGIRLPEDYREFVAGLAHGCPGPYQGILRLDCWAEGSPWPAGDGPNDYLARACPVRPDMPHDDQWHLALGCPFEERFQGTMAVSRQGGSRYCLLIVSGPCRGRILLVDMAQGVPRFVQQLKFLDWYEDWLDETVESAEFEVV